MKLTHFTPSSPWAAGGDGVLLLRPPPSDVLVSGLSSVSSPFPSFCCLNLGGSSCRQLGGGLLGWPLGILVGDCRLLLYPDCFERGIANTSFGWSS